MIWVSHKYHLNHHAATDLSFVESDAWDCKSPAPPQDVNHALQTPEATMYTHVSTFTSALKPSRFEVLVLLEHSGTSQQQPPSFHRQCYHPEWVPQTQCSMCAVLQLWGHSHTGWNGTGLRLLRNWRKRCPDITCTSYTRVTKRMPKATCPTEVLHAKWSYGRQPITDMAPLPLHQSLHSGKPAK